MKSIFVEFKNNEGVFFNTTSTKLGMTKVKILRTSPFVSVKCFV
jgi:hypothetical protein